MGRTNQRRISYRSRSGGGVALAGFGLALLVVALTPPMTASADTVISGPIDLGVATPFAVLAGTTVTNVPVSSVWGNVGVAPGSAITGFGLGEILGTTHPNDGVAGNAQVALTAAYGVAASLTPMQTGLGDLTLVPGGSLVPGVYQGNLSLSDIAGPAPELTLVGTGSANDVWVFQASSTLLIASGTRILITGGASACNVFWQVGSSATIGTGAVFVGTVMADASITANTTATIEGRLLARTGAVTLDQNVITAPGACATGAVGVSPVVTSTTDTTATVGVPYDSGYTATGTPSPTDTITSGALPPGLTLDTATGEITGTPTTPGTYTFEVTVSNGVSPDVVLRAQQIVVRAGLAVSGADPGPLFALGLGAFALGALLLATRHRPARRAR